MRVCFSFSKNKVIVKILLKAIEKLLLKKVHKCIEYDWF